MSSSESSNHGTAVEEIPGENAPNQCQKRQTEDDSAPAKKLKLSNDQEPKSYENSPNEFLNKFLDPLIYNDEDWVLHNWLFCKNLLKTPSECNSCRSKKIQLVMSTEEWQCVECTKRFCIRSGSFFLNLPCSIKNVIKCVVAWSRHEDPEVTGNILGLKKITVTCIYQRCLDTIMSYMEDEFSRNWVLGGPGTVALLDQWPNGYIPCHGLLNESKRAYKDRIRVVWIADTNHMPVRYLAQLLPPQRSPNYLLSGDDTLNSHPGPTGCPKSEFKEEVNNSSDGILKRDECESVSSDGKIDRSPGSCEERHKRQQVRVLKEQQELINTQECLKRYIGEGDQKNQKMKDRKQKLSKKKLHCECEINEEKCPLQENDNSEILHERESNEETQTNEFRGSEGENTVQKYIEGIKEFEIPKMQNKKSSVKIRSRSPGAREKREAERLRSQQIIDYLQLKDTSDAVLSLAFHHIAPGSLVIVNENVFPDVIDSLHACGRYEAVKSINELMSADENEGRLTITILENIWKNAAKLCQDMRKTTYRVSNILILEFQWRQMFGSPDSRAAYHILSQIASYYVPKPKRETGKVSRRSAHI